MAAQSSCARGTSHRILGIDFSGASDAGRKIWIAEARLSSDGPLALTDIRPACELENGGDAPDVAIAALRRHILLEAGTVAGCDFPFSIPRTLIEEESWEAFISAFPARFDHADAFRDWAFRKAGMKETRRVTDQAVKTPFNSYNIRIHRQTWWGVRALLHPLVISKTAVIRPYQAMPKDGRPIVIEACPASSMKSIGFYPPYKGRSERHRLARRAVVRRLVDDGYLEMPGRSVQRRLLDNAGGDALDAVIAAIATAQADLSLDADANELFEGRIYGPLRTAAPSQP
jgi:hypothetical protein